MADCEETLRELQLFLDGELPADERAHVLEHLDECLECFHAYDFQAELKRIIAIKCQSDVMPSDLLERIVQQLRDAGGTSPVEPDAGAVP